MTELLLKARPTVEQLRDRLATPVPDGLELYLDRLDLINDTWRQTILAHVGACTVRRQFSWIVEAPIRTLDDQFFDLTADDKDHRETLRRVVVVGADLGAVAANIHVVAPTLQVKLLTHSERERCLDRSLNLLHFYVERCAEAGLIPQVENVPPVGRMRESAFVYSSIGSAPRDLLALADAFPSLRFTVDTSHAALYLNWRRAAGIQVKPGLERAVEFHRDVESTDDLVGFLGRLVAKTTTVHVSNARGLLGEGLCYSDGDEDLNVALRPLVGRVAYFVAEILEPDPRNAVGMREAQTRLRALIDSVKGSVA